MFYSCLLLTSKVGEFCKKPPFPSFLSIPCNVTGLLLFLCRHTTSRFISPSVTAGNGLAVFVRPKCHWLKLVRDALHNWAEQAGQGWEGENRNPWQYLDIYNVLQCWLLRLKYSMCQKPMHSFPEFLQNCNTVKKRLLIFFQSINCWGGGGVCNQMGCPVLLCN